MDLRDLYKQLIIEESQNPAQRREVEDATHSGQGKNPSCGDELSLELRLNPTDERIEDCAFQGVGCAISTASASIMSKLLKGKTAAEAKQLLREFLKLIREGEVSADEEEHLGEAMAFADISRMPARVKCAVLAWHTALNLLGEEADRELDPDEFLD
ncbi:MAG: SUF system NifU family Fe-S cluster assembly protein [Eubacteriales bacterium]|nr:SUF system NifU family Fe-S cluster assembly protein [Eubacteriales bacterium]